MTTLNTTGTITVANGSATVTGAGSNWTAALITSGILFVAGGSYPIASVESNTSLTLAFPYAGTSGAGKAYAISVETRILEQTTKNANSLADLLSGISSFSVFSRSLAGGVDGAAWRDGLELGNMATQAADNVAITGGTGVFSALTSSGNVAAATVDTTDDITIVSGTANLWVKGTTGATTFDGSGGGVLMTGASMNGTSKYGPALKFGSTDPNFTTTNPKVGAAIIGAAAQTYALDTNGGMDLEFWTAPGNPGTSHGLVQRAVLTSDGKLGLGTTAPARVLDVRGDASIQDVLVINGIGSANPQIALRDDGTTRGTIGIPNGTTRLSLNASAGFSDHMNISSVGYTALGHNDPDERLDVLGRMLMQTSMSDTTAKQALFGMRQYDLSQSPFFFLQGYSSVTSNVAYIGGGTGSGNAATEIRLMTAANNTTPTGTTQVIVDGSGNVQFLAYGAGTLTTDSSGHVTASSDERLKTGIVPFERGLVDVLAIDPIKYHWSEASGLDQMTEYAGFSAQNVDLAIPEAIGVGGKGFLSLDMRPIMAALVNAVKELNEQNRALMARIEALEA